MAQSMTTRALAIQNRQFLGTGGVSSENRALGFVPGFLDRETGYIYRSCAADGCPAPIHHMGGLPDVLVTARDAAGRVVAVKASVVAGFILDESFYTREQVADALSYQG